MQAIENKQLEKLLLNVANVSKSCVFNMLAVGTKAKKQA
jgi:hypothetical protein